MIASGRFPAARAACARQIGLQVYNVSINALRDREDAQNPTTIENPEAAPRLPDTSPHSTFAVSWGSRNENGRNCSGIARRESSPFTS
jgi:hypothetical protein